MQILDRYKKTALFLASLVIIVSICATSASMAQADPSRGLHVGGQYVTSENASNIPVDAGTASFDPNTNTLTLNNATITTQTDWYSNTTGGLSPVLFGEARTLTIKLIGTNKIGNESTDIGLYHPGWGDPTASLIIEGDGTLDITAKRMGIRVEHGNLTIKNGAEVNLTITGNDVTNTGDTYNVYGIQVENGYGVTLNEATLKTNVTGNSAVGISSQKVTSANSNATISVVGTENSNAAGIDTGTDDSSKVTISGGSIDIKAKSSGSTNSTGLQSKSFAIESGTSSIDADKPLSPDDINIELGEGINQATDTEGVVTFSDKFTITFDSNGGAPAPDAQLITKDGTVTKPADPSKENAVFAGWYADPDFTKAWNFSDDTVTENLTLYAKWNPAEKTYSVSVTNGEGSGKYAEGETVSISANSIENEKFLNWTGTEGVVFDNAHAATTTFIMPAHNVEVTANFEDLAVQEKDELAFMVKPNPTIWLKGSSRGITAKINGEATDLVSITIDGNALSENDFEIASGSTLLTLKPAYLQKLSVGTHTLTISYNEGESIKAGTLSAQFETKNPIQKTPVSNTQNTKAALPKTSDLSMVSIVFAGLGLLSLGVLFNRNRKVNH